MRSRTLTCMPTMTLFAVLAAPIQLAAQEQNKPQPCYMLIDLGTFGGPVSYSSAAGQGSLVLNNRQTVTGYADTTTPDPYAPNCFDPDCFVAHSFRWQDGA